MDSEKLIKNSYDAYLMHSENFGWKIVLSGGGGVINKLESLLEENNEEDRGV